jgi:hypothetical protein
VLRVELEGAVLPAEEVVVPEREKLHRRARRCGAALLEVHEPAVVLHQLAGDRLEAGARVALGQPAPVREIGLGRRTERREVTARELGQRRVAVDALRRRADPVLGADVRVLSADERPADGDALVAGGEREVDERLTFDAGALDELGAGERPVVRQCAADRLDRALRLARLDAVELQPSLDGGGLRRRGQRDEPVHVLGADEVQRAAVDPRHDEGPVVQRCVHVLRGQPRYARAEGELCGAQVLRLQREVVANDFFGRPRRLAREQLRRGAQDAQAGRRHPALRARSTSARTRQPTRWSLTSPQACIIA